GIELDGFAREGSVDHKSPSGSQRSKDASAGLAADRVERITHSIPPGDALDLFVDRSLRRADHGVSTQAGQLLLGLRTADNVDRLEPVMTAQLDDHLPSVEPAADWSSHSPLGTSRTCRTMASTVAGFTKNVAACSSAMSAGMGRA